MSVTSLANSLVFDSLKRNKPVLDLYKSFIEGKSSPNPASSGVKRFLGIVDSQDEEEDDITKNYMDLSQNQAEIDANLEAAGFESNPQREARLAEQERKAELAASDNLEQRKMLRGRITEAFGRGLSRKNLAKEIGILRGEAANLDIDPTAFEREVKEERGIFNEEAKRKRDYDNFFARANDPNRTLGSGSRREVYSRRKRLKLAKQLQKDGFTRAAEAVALDYARSPEAMAPAISTPALRRQMEEDSSRAREIRDMNRGLTQLLIAKTQQELKDPEFKLFT